MIATFVIDQVRWVGRDRAQHDLVGHLHLPALCPILWGGKIAGGRRLQRRPYSCQLLDDSERQCTFGQCDARLLARLRRECLRDGGRP